MSTQVDTNPCVDRGIQTPSVAILVIVSCLILLDLEEVVAEIVQAVLGKHVQDKIKV
jgi:hypothetical protein